MNSMRMARNRMKAITRMGCSTRKDVRFSRMERFRTKADSAKDFVMAKVRSILSVGFSFRLQSTHMGKRVGNSRDSTITRRSNSLDSQRTISEKEMPLSIIRTVQLLFRVRTRKARKFQVLNSMNEESNSLKESTKKKTKNEHNLFSKFSQKAAN